MALLDKPDVLAWLHGPAKAPNTSVVSMVKTPKVKPSVPKVKASEILPPGNLTATYPTAVTPKGLVVTRKSGSDGSVSSAPPIGGGGGAGGSTTAVTPQGNTSTGSGGSGVALADLLKFLKSPDLSGQAAALAKNQVGSEIGAIRSNQRILLNEGQQKALAILAASRAGADMTKSLAPGIRDAYSGASKDLAAIAGGYTGALGDTLTANANHVADQIGGKAPLTAGGLNINTLPQGAANTAYALGGDLPADSLARMAATAFSAASSVPQQILGGGQQGSLLALGGAQQAANNLNGDVTTAAAKLPGLTASNLASLSAAHQDRISNVLKAFALSNSSDLGWAKLGETQGYHAGLLNARTRALNIAAAKNKTSPTAWAKITTQAHDLAYGRTAIKTVNGVPTPVILPGYNAVPDFDTAVQKLVTDHPGLSSAQAAAVLSQETPYHDTLVQNAQQQAFLKSLNI